MELFKEWLEGEKGLQKTSAKDVASRLRRAGKMVGSLNQLKENGVNLEQLEKKKEFLSLGVSVKSQLRAAVRHYKEYLGSTK